MAMISYNGVLRRMGGRIKKPASKIATIRYMTEGFAYQLYTHRMAGCIKCYASLKKKPYIRECLFLIEATKG